MIPTISQLHRMQLEGANRSLALYFDAIFRDVKVATMPSSVATVGTTSVQVLASLGTRVYAQLINDSDSAVYLAFGEAAVTNQGVRLNAKGGIYEVNWYNLWRGAINAITTGANKKLSTVDGRVG